MIILLIEAKVAAANREAFLTAARAQAEASRQEEGCLVFDILENPHAPGDVRFFELWRSAEDLTLHRDQPHSKHFRENGRTLADSLSARKFEATELT